MPLIDVYSSALFEVNAFPLSFSTQEELSNSSSYSLEFECAQADLDYEKFLGEGVGIQIELPEFGTRPFYAYVIGISDIGQHQDKFVYKLELSTWLWFLMQNRNCRIFQDLNVLDIIERIFARYSFAKYRLDIQGNYPDLEYCVQFSETDFAFINRLLENEGIWYYFDHEDDKHTLVITDRENFADLPEAYSVLPFIPDSEEKRAIREGVQRIHRSRKVRPNEVVLRDFDYLNPRTNLQTKVEESRLGLHDTPLEWYDYAAGYVDTTRGEHLARLRLEEMQSEAHQLFGESNAAGLVCGRSFTLTQHPDLRRNRRFKLLRCAYTFIQDGPDSSSAGRNLTCQFSALNDDVAFRPARTTARPQMPGIQSATVVGAHDAEVHTDEFARIRVHFHWDRDKTTEEDSSCWIRVVQAWAGKGWGVVAMPRVGQEVLISYVDGDLDRPMVTGIVYNGDNPPPYRLPEHINYSGLVSRSLRHGNPQHASQLTFDDNRDNERVMLHAERDMQMTVERNRSENVGQDQFRNVVRTSTEVISNLVTYRNNSFDFTGIKGSVTGIEAALTGVSLKATGVSKAFTGVSTSFTGVDTSFKGVSTSFNGMSSEFTGQSTQCIGKSTSMIGESSSFISLSHQLIGVSSSYTGLSSSFTGVSTSMIGVSTSIVGSAISCTGVNVETTGSSTSLIGSSVSSIGNSVATFGSHTEAIGSYAVAVGISSHVIGMQISQTGASLSLTGVELIAVGMQCKN